VIKNGSPNNATVFSLDLNVLDETIHFQIEVGQGQAKLADIVPLARSVCSSIIDVVLKTVRSKGDRIPCLKGCSACCNRCLVPLSVPEAFRLKEDIEKMPVLRRETIWKDCLDASRYILTRKPPKKFIHQSARSSSNDSSHLNLISSWYSSLKLPCPFLYQGVCSIYELRPLACSEHYITGSAEGCSEEHSSAKLIEMPIQVPNALSRLASELEETSDEAVILPLAQVWCQNNKKRAARTWPYVLMVRRFVEILKEMSNKNSAILAV
jgi:Fe-S-cluster containining protein